jgi:hypothetical protein
METIQWRWTLGTGEDLFKKGSKSVFIVQRRKMTVDWKGL